jgi:hypothetical protein
MKITQSHELRHPMAKKIISAIEEKKTVQLTYQNDLAYFATMVSALVYFLIFGILNITIYVPSFWISVYLIGICLSLIAFIVVKKVLVKNILFISFDSLNYVLYGDSQLIRIQDIKDIEYNHVESGLSEVSSVCIILNNGEQYELSVNKWRYMHKTIPIEAWIEVFSEILKVYKKKE